MKRQLLAAAGALVVLAVPAAAAASPAPVVSFSPGATPSASPSPIGPVPLNDWCGGDPNVTYPFTVYSQNAAWYPDAFWAVSTKVLSWYDSTSNKNDFVPINCASSGEYLEIQDQTGFGCATVSGTAPYQIYSYHCTPGKASQEFGVQREGTSFNDGYPQWGLFNQWIEQHVTRCNKVNNLFVTANTENSGLIMRCPAAGGALAVNQLWGSGSNT